MKDERVILKERLIKVGIDESNSATIALDAGSSQCIVNKLYLIESGIPSQFIEKALKEIVLFYMEELFEVDES